MSPFLCVCFQSRLGGMQRRKGRWSARAGFTMMEKIPRGDSLPASQRFSTPNPLNPFRKIAGFNPHSLSHKALGDILKFSSRVIPSDFKLCEMGLDVVLGYTPNRRSGPKAIAIYEMGEKVASILL